MGQISPPATAEEVLEIVGPLDDWVLMRIVETEATPAEVLEAFTWLPLTIRSAPNWNTDLAAPLPRSMKSSNAKNRNRKSADNLDVESGR